jgi:hypothetical protein
MRPVAFALLMSLVPIASLAETAKAAFCQELTVELLAIFDAVTAVDGSELSSFADGPTSPDQLTALATFAEKLSPGVEALTRAMAATQAFCS